MPKPKQPTHQHPHRHRKTRPNDQHANTKQHLLAPPLQQHQTTTNTPTTTYTSIHSIGATCLIEKLLQNLKIANILNNTFGEEKTKTSQQPPNT
jgi:hypothetical protein